MTVRVVAISREHGAGGEQVGALVAERLGFRYVDDEIVAQAAARGNINHAESPTPRSGGRSPCA